MQVPRFLGTPYRVLELMEGTSSFPFFSLHKPNRDFAFHIPSRSSIPSQLLYAVGYPIQSYLPVHTYHPTAIKMFGSKAGGPPSLGLSINTGAANTLWVPFAFSLLLFFHLPRASQFLVSYSHSPVACANFFFTNTQRCKCHLKSASSSRWSIRLDQRDATLYPNPQPLWQHQHH